MPSRSVGLLAASCLWTLSSRSFAHPLRSFNPPPRPMKAAFLALLVALFATLAQASLHNEAVSHRRHPSTLLERAAAKKNGLRRSGLRCNKNATTKVAPTATKAPAKPKPKPTPNNVNGLIKTNWKCNGKSSGATRNVTVSTGPNGSQDWLNCGINGGGWTPPPVKLKDLVVVSLRDSLKDKNSPFHACGPYLNIFEKYAKRYGLEPILLASFAMQESGCKPETQGMGGEQGMMQITREKCKGRSDAACREPDYNIGTAAKFFSDTLKNDGGNIILSVGRYNGFHEGLTYKKATAARYTKCCRCMNNLDYPMQYFNGWLLGKNPYGMKLGTVNNLAWCPKY